MKDYKLNLRNLHVCVLEVIGTPSILSVIRKVATLERVLPTFAFRVCKKCCLLLIDKARDKDKTCI
jgi:hypothetical protein